MIDFKQYENKHKGKRCFILGCAPSILNEDLSLLDDEIVLVCNKAFLLTEHGLKNYDYFFCTDIKVYRQIKSEMGVPDNCVRVYSGNISKVINIKEDFIEITKKKNILKNTGIGDTFQDMWGTTGTVAFETVITAFFMGFSEIYMLGVDLYYSGDNTHFYKTNPASREQKFKHSIKTNEKNIIKHIELINNHLSKYNVKWCNLSSGFKMKHLMETDTLRNIIKNT